MKNVFRNCLIIAAIALTAVALTSCKSRSNSAAAAEAQKAAQAAVEAETARLAAEEAALQAAIEAAIKNKDSNGVKLLESIIFGDGATTRFEYDYKNRLVKISNYQGGETMYVHMFSYPDGDGNMIEFSTPMEVMASFGISGNSTINVNHTYADNALTITLNKDGYLAKYEMQSYDEPDNRVYTFQYQDGNMILEKYDDNVAESVTELKYDDKKSPLLNCASPKWLLHWYFFDSAREYFGLNNNVTETTTAIFKYGVNAIRKNVYEYDSDGFPIKRTTTEVRFDPEETAQTTVTTFIYSGL
ncbi:MAG: hypothetical protein LBH05_07360 [Deferribacteraceae bacterium]|jgi:catechol 2,3-dioxygenase-like lactoylglutathione lyase family enzyme|nr:hypothetical protein [Deferribacteraceae bacterium]